MTDKPEFCTKHGCELVWLDCYNCEDGYSEHDCGEDTCCCLNPENNVECDVCNAAGGWIVCPECHAEAEKKLIKGVK